MHELSGLIERLQSNVFAEAEDARKELARRRDLETVSAVCELLRADNPQIRNVAALIVRKIGHQSAKAPLIAAIDKPCNRGNEGTLLYAVQTLDCSDCFTFLVRIVIGRDYECACMAMQILQEQHFSLSSAELRKAAVAIEQYDESKDLGVDWRTPFVVGLRDLVGKATTDR